MGATGESVKRVSDTGFNPSWSPDGERIVFSTEGVRDPGRSITGGELRVLGVDSGEVHAIDVGGDAVQPHWSPHGYRIAFWSYDLSERNYRDIWTVLAEGGEIVPVTRDEYVDWNPVWSPDGRHLYFYSSRGGAMSLWRVAIEEESGFVQGAPELVTASPAARMGQTSIARNDLRIAYQADIGTQNLYRISFDPESEAVVGEPIPITSGSRWAIYPDLSPDGKRLAFTIARGGGQADIALIEVDGTGLRQLTDQPHFSNYRPRWSPDGSELVFYSGRSGAFQLWSIHPDGSDLRQLTDGPHWINAPEWSPDGKSMAYFSTEGDSFTFRPDLPWKEQSPVKLPRPPEGKFSATSWSPNGQRLAGFVEVGPAKFQIAIFSLVSREYRVFPVPGEAAFWLGDSRRLLIRSAGKIFLLDGETGSFHEVLSLEPDAVEEMLDLSSDDRTIYFSRMRSEADIWMLTLGDTQDGRGHRVR